MKLSCSVSYFAHLSNSSSESSPDFVFQVLQILRYPIDPRGTFICRNTFSVPPSLDLRELFDLILSDGKRQFKVFLHPQNYPLIYFQNLKQYSIINIRKSMLYIDELQPTHTSFACLEEVLIHQTRSSVCLIGTTAFTILSGSATRSRYSRTRSGSKAQLTPEDLELRIATSIPWIDPTAADSHAKPLLTARDYYLDCETDAVNPETFETLRQEIATIGQLFWKSSAEQRNSRLVELKEALTLRDCPLLGVVQWKTKLFHFDRPNQSHPYPFRFQLHLAGHYAGVNVTIWDGACKKYFATIAPGDIIQIKKYAKKNYQGELEISVNAKNPAGIISHVPDSWITQLSCFNCLPKFPLAEEYPPEKVPPGRLAPVERLAFKFVPVNRLLQHTGDPIDLDLVGRLTFVGEVYRLRQYQYQDSQDYADPLDDVLVAETSEIVTRTAKFHYCRWIKMVDISSDKELSLQLFANSQMNAFQELKLNETLVLTNLRYGIPAEESNPSASTPISVEDDPRHQLSCTFRTQIINEAGILATPHMKQYVPEVRSVLQASDLATTNKAPSYFYPCQLKDFRLAFEGVKMVPLSSIAPISEQVFIHEHQTVAIKARFHSICLDRGTRRWWLTITNINKPQSQVSFPLSSSSTQYVPFYHRSPSSLPTVIGLQEFLSFFPTDYQELLAAEIHTLPTIPTTTSRPSKRRRAGRPSSASTVSLYNRQFWTRYQSKIEAVLDDQVLVVIVGLYRESATEVDRYIQTICIP